MKELPLEALINSMPGGKELRGDSGIRSVDALHKLATLWSQQEISKLPKVPDLMKVFEQAISDLNRDKVIQPLYWANLFASAETLLPQNSMKQKLLDSIRKHLPSSSDGTI